MPSEISYRILYAVSFLAGFPSLLGSSYILHSWRKSKKKQNYTNDLLNNYVGYMSIADFLLVLLMMIYVSNPAFSLTFMSQLPHWVCGVLGGAFNIFAITTTTFNFVIATFVLVPMLKGVPMYTIKKRNIYILLFTFVICLLEFILPFITSNKGSYGLTENGADKYGLTKFQCWIANPDDFICLYVFTFFYYWWSAFVLLYWCCFHRNDKSMKLLTSRLFGYTIAFVFVWSGPVLNRFYTIITGEISFGLLCYHWVTVQCVGWCNALVWYSYIKPNNDILKISNSLERYNSFEMHGQMNEIVE
eukprot:66431_1